MHTHTLDGCGCTLGGHCGRDGAAAAVGLGHAYYEYAVGMRKH